MAELARMPAASSIAGPLGGIDRRGGRTGRVGIDPRPDRVLPGRPAPRMIAVDQHVAGLLDRVGDDQEVQVLARNRPFLEQRGHDPVEKSRPVGLTKENDRKPVDLVRLDERERLEQLVERAEAARER